MAVEQAKKMFYSHFLYVKITLLTLLKRNFDYLFHFFRNPFVFGAFSYIGQR